MPGTLWGRILYGGVGLRRARASGLFLLAAGCVVAGAGGHADPSTHTPGAGARTENGIDVSHYQGRIVWPEAARGGIAFAYIKLTEGTRSVDANADENARGARAGGVPFGYYHFLVPSEDPGEQARHFLAELRAKPRSQLRPALDVETHRAETVAQLVSSVRTWLDAVSAEVECAPLIYSSSGFWTKYLESPFRDHPRWLAHYAPEPPPEPWDLWQRTAGGRVPGVDRPVDRNTLSERLGGVRALACPALSRVRAEDRSE